MARIGVIGAQSTGKTTLISHLMKEPEFKNYLSVESPTRYLKIIFGMDFDNANTEIQLSTLCMQAINTFSAGSNDAFFDRTVIDNYAYLQYYAGRGHSDLSASALNFIQYTSRFLATKLDVIVLLHREFAIVPDGTRIVDEQQQGEIEDRIMKNLDDFGIDVRKIISLSGTVEERVANFKLAFNKIVSRGE
jgi:nicotinamide riboside kinase